MKKKFRGYLFLLISRKWMHVKELLNPIAQNFYLMCKCKFESSNIYKICTWINIHQWKLKYGYILIALLSILYNIFLMHYIVTHLHLLCIYYNTVEYIIYDISHILCIIWLPQENLD